MVDRYEEVNSICIRVAYLKFALLVIEAVAVDMVALQAVGSFCHFAVYANYFYAFPRVSGIFLNV